MYAQSMFRPFFYNITPDPKRSMRSTYCFAEGFSVVEILFYDPNTACNRIDHYETSRANLGSCRSGRLHDGLHGGCSLFYGHYDLIIINNPYKLRVNVHVSDAECKLRNTSAYFNGRQPQTTVIFFIIIYIHNSRDILFFFLHASEESFFY